eukprot:scaffold44790_cov21-Tisochrysis_lutea.AAC.1
MLCATVANIRSDGSEVRVLSCNAFVNEGSRESGPVFIVTRHDITSLCKQHQVRVPVMLGSSFFSSSR